MKNQYYLFISGEDDINNICESLEFRDKNIVQSLCILFKSIDDEIIICKEHDDLSMFRDKLDTYKENSIYVVDCHKELSKLTYWELGYALGALGRGLTVVGYHDPNKGESKMDPQVKSLVGDRIKGGKKFLELIKLAIDRKKISKDDYDKMARVSRAEQ